MQRNDNWIDQVILSMPEYATDIGTELDALFNNNTLAEVDIHACALAAAISASNGPLAFEISMNGPLRGSPEREIAFKAASFMGRNNLWNRFTKIAGGDTLVTSDDDNQKKFEMYALTSSIVGEDSVSIKSYMSSLEKQGLSIEQLHSIAKIACIVVAIGKVTP